MKQSDDGLARDGHASPQGSGVADGHNGGTGLVPRKTGPRTTAGKRRSRYNATKHGIFSSVVVLENESRKDFILLLGGLQKSLQPVDELEEILIEVLAVLFWRRRRLLVAESAEIRMGREFLDWNRKQLQRLQAEEQARKTSEAITLPRDVASLDSKYKEGLIWSAENPAILDRCLELLSDLQANFKDNGFSSPKNEPILEAICGQLGRNHLNQTLFDIYDEWCEKAKVSQKEREREGYPSRDECKANVLKAIDAELERLKRAKKEQLMMEARQTEIEKLRQNVPDSHALERLMRYESTLERFFDRTLTQLERRQRIRLGQAVPPPVKVEVSKD